MFGLFLSTYSCKCTYNTCSTFQRSGSRLSYHCVCALFLSYTFSGKSPCIGSQLREYSGENTKQSSWGSTCFTVPQSIECSSTAENCQGPTQALTFSAFLLSLSLSIR